MSDRARLTRLFAVIPLIAAISLVVPASEIEARGGRGGRGGGGGFGGGGISRGGVARGGSVMAPRSGGGYGSQRSSSGSWNRSAQSGAERSRTDPGTTQREGSFENRRGETIDYSGSVTRTEDGIEREGSWTSTSGASGSSSSKIEISDGQVQSAERSRHAENAAGETLDREVTSERHGDHIDREGEIKSSTGIDAESKATIEKIDDGFIVQGGIVGEEGAAGGTIVRQGDETWARGAATDGKKVTWGGAHCDGSHCYGGRATVKVKDYYKSSYYYYPYYYGWYSCPYGGMQTWYNHYGTPVYGCSNVVVVHTTISLGATESPATSRMSAGVGASTPWPREAEVSSAPVLMYEVEDAVVAYSTTYEPMDVYAEKHGERYYWVPGPERESAETVAWIGKASDLEEPTANSTVITYTAEGRTVYLTNERPVRPYFAETADYLSVWIPGVTDPTEVERSTIQDVIAAHRSGGSAALDREVRKLEQGREPPPADVGAAAP